MTGLLQIRAIDPSLGSLRLDDIDLIDRLGRAFEKAERRVLSWAYFAKVLATTVAKARTRVATLEAAGLLSHESLRSGNVYFMTSKGQAVLRALRDAPVPELRRPPSEPASRAEAPLAPAVPEPPASSHHAKTERRFEPVRRQELMTWAGAELGQKILGLPDGPRELIAEALAAGRDLTLPEVARTGLPLFAAVEMLASLSALRRPMVVSEPAANPGPDRSVPDVGAPTSTQMRLPSGTSPGNQQTSIAAPKSPATSEVADSRRSSSMTRQPEKADGRPRADGGDRTCPTAGEGEGAAVTLARLAMQEAQRRHPELARTPTFAGQLLPELVWASMKGVLADYGEPLRRVRTALRLMSERRWTTPRHMPKSFVSEFVAGEPGLAIC